MNPGRRYAVLVFVPDEAAQRRRECEAGSGVVKEEKESWWELELRLGKAPDFI